MSHSDKKEQFTKELYRLWSMHADRKNYKVSRRDLIKGMAGLGLGAGAIKMLMNQAPFSVRQAWAAEGATPEERAINGAKALFDSAEKKTISDADRDEAVTDRAFEIATSGPFDKFVKVDGGAIPANGVTAEDCRGVLEQAGIDDKHQTRLVVLTHEELPATHRARSPTSSGKRGSVTPEEKLIRSGS